MKFVKGDGTILFFLGMGLWVAIYDQFINKSPENGVCIILLAIGAVLIKLFYVSDEISALTNNGAKKDEH